ncbi:MAG: hypothetical protein RL115_1833 [Bacteroidota bacterium]
MRIRFRVRFSTKYGQSLWMSGNIAALGNNMVSEALPMLYLNEEYWQVEIKIKKADKIKSINYYYLLKNEDGQIVEEWKGDRIIELDKKELPVIDIVDCWNYAGAFENTFFTIPFQQVLLKNETPTYKPNHEKGATHYLKVKAPLLQKGEVVCLLGSAKKWGNWNHQQPLLLEKKDNWWTIKVNLSLEEENVFYKYGIYNVVHQKFVAFEGGDNRILSVSLIKETDFNIIHDGFIQMPNNTWRGAGIAIPVFSLRSHQSFGVGEFTDLKLLVDWANHIGLKLIQLLPVNDTISSFSWQDSYPYSAVSAFALHPIYLNVHAVANDEHTALLNKYTKVRKKLNETDSLDYEAVLEIKLEILRQLYGLMGAATLASKEFKSFYKKNKHWLNPYAVFCYGRDKYKTAAFSQWQTLSIYHSEEVENMCHKKSPEYEAIGFYFFTQYQLHLQLKEAVEYAHSKNIVMKGDIPIGISRNSCDAWVAPSLYHMEWQAGAPPDDFAEAGQNWGFPTYNWEAMQADGYTWWKQRFEQMAHYFDAFRIDHILGFFRIWSVPIEQVQGILGRFHPCIPIHINEFGNNGIWFDYERFCKPFITAEILHQTFGEATEKVVKHFFSMDEKGMYAFVPTFDTQQKVVAYFNQKSPEANDAYIQTGLLNLIANVILLPEEGAAEPVFHFRIGMEKTSSYQNLIPHLQEKLKQLYLHYFYTRQDDCWRKEALHKLPMLKAATNMLICGEDLGMVPDCVPQVMEQLGILSLEIQRMPKNSGVDFFIPSAAPYLSVITPSTHDMSTVREWWIENKNITQQFYNQVLGQVGAAPATCEAWICKAIILQHLHSPAMWSIFQLQDILSISEPLRHTNPLAERINVPANPKHYWQYRMHLFLEDLLKEEAFTQEFSSYIQESRR